MGGMWFKEIYETFTYEAYTVQNGSFTISQKIRERLRYWNVKLYYRWLPVIILDENGKELYRCSKKFSSAGQVSSPVGYNKHVDSYTSMRFTIVHYLDGRKSDLEIKLQKIAG